MANSITRDIPRIRAILDQLGIRNVEYEDPADYVPSAIINAMGRRKLVALQAALAKADLITDGPVDIGQKLLERLAELHSFVAPAHTPVDARVAARRLLIASDLVCRIDVGHRHGTGLLVTPTLVATAAHLVSDLVDARGPGYPTPRAGSTSGIHVIFGDMTDLLDGTAPPTPLTPMTAPLAASWLAFYSPPTAEETEGEGFVLDSVADIGEDGPWDLAILRLAEARPVRPMPPRGTFLETRSRSTSCTIPTTAGAGSSRCCGRSGRSTGPSEIRPCGSCIPRTRPVALRARRSSTRSSASSASIRRDSNRGRPVAGPPSTAPSPCRPGHRSWRHWSFPRPRHACRRSRSSTGRATR
ncbi:hypothetical protein R1T08_16795 [Streptomyces sp. SBC-4]|nr:hypothetical protein [Streptomyces sp. SBC-4]MDV5145821.1 hypothetical protein [Streptomyces sp. SBC-4]